jgi:hypothetical protein
MPGPSDEPLFAWTSPQRRALIVLLVGLLLFISVRYACNPVYVSDPQPPWPSRAHELADRVDPNVADWQTLAALPVIGEKRAKAIVAYRDRFRERNPDRPAFAQMEDLQFVNGVGPAMTTSLRPYLYFPRPQSAPATTRPGS